MKFFYFSIMILIPIFGSSQTLAEVRKSFHLAVLDPEKSEEFHDFLKNSSSMTPIMKAYKATSEAMYARAVWNPFTKLSQVLKYSDLMEIAVEEDELNAEIRFLRFAIEYNLPRFLGMSKHLDEDLEAVVANRSSIPSMKLDASFSRYIIYFLRDTDLPTENEMEKMEIALTSNAYSETNSH